jgi:hypothetical protein
MLCAGMSRRACASAEVLAYFRRYYRHFFPALARVLIA